MLGLEPLTCMDAAPGDADRKQAGGLRRLDVEGRVADVGGLVCAGAEPVEREQQWFRVGLVPRRFVAADNRLEQVCDRNARERELDRLTPLRGDDSQSPTLVFQPNEHAVHTRAADELVV